MINAGRVLIIPKGEWTNLEPYEMLDLVTRGDIAYIARQASVGVDPATDTQLTYWQPFGTAAKIATTSVPGIVMPDGTTITIDETGLITANLGVSDLNNVAISSIANGQILQYNSTTQKFENKSLGTAAARNATSAITSGSTDLIESGAVSSLKETLESEIGDLTDLDTTVKTDLVSAINAVNTATETLDEKLSNVGTYDSIVTTGNTAWDQRSVSIDQYRFIELTLSNSTGRIYGTSIVPKDYFITMNSANNPLAIEVYTTARSYGECYYTSGSIHYRIGQGSLLMTVLGIK